MTLASTNATTDMLGKLLDCVQVREWLPSSVDHVVLAPSLGFLAPGLASPPSWIRALVRGLASVIPNLHITIAGCGTNPVSGSALLERSGFADLAAQEGWGLIDLAAAPAYQIQEPRLSMPVRVPALAFTRHTLITLVPLATDPVELLSGTLAHQLTLFPDLLRPDLWPYRYRGAQLASQLWPPDLCILDARRVTLHSQTRLTRSTEVALIGCLLAGRNPRAVDARAAELLGLTTRQVPFLRRTRALDLQDGEAVIQIGDNTSLKFSPQLSPFAYPRRWQESFARFTGDANRVVNRAVERLDIPRIVDFIRRAKGRSG